MYLLISFSAMPGTLHIVYVCEMLLVVNKLVVEQLLSRYFVASIGGAIKCITCTDSESSKRISSMLLGWNNFKIYIC